MTPEQKAKIEELATIADQKRQTFLMLGMRNIMGRLAEEREQMAREYAVAEAEMMEANAALEAAIAARLCED